MTIDALKEKDLQDR